MSPRVFPALVWIVSASSWDISTDAYYRLSDRSLRSGIICILLAPASNMIRKLKARVVTLWSSKPKATYLEDLEHRKLPNVLQILYNGKLLFGQEIFTSCKRIWTSSATWFQNIKDGAQGDEKCSLSQSFSMASGSYTRYNLAKETGRLTEMTPGQRPTPCA
jgi:hypothetical protein